MKTIAEITAEIETQFASALKDKRRCFDMEKEEIEFGGSLLSDMASEAGHDSLRGFINSGSQWGETVGNVAEYLADSIALIRSESEGHGPFADMDDFMAAR